MFTAPKSRDLPGGRVMIQPDAQDVARRINIAVMQSPAVRTILASYSRRTYRMRNAGKHGSCARARLESVMFIRFDKPGSAPSGLRAQYAPERRSTRIEHRLGYSRPSAASDVHIADDNPFIVPGGTPRSLAQVVASGFGDLRLDRPGPLLGTGPLRDSAIRWRARAPLRSAREAPVSKTSNDTWRRNALPSRPERRGTRAGNIR